jgi:hypothetical protein
VISGPKAITPKVAIIVVLCCYLVSFALPSIDDNNQRLGILDPGQVHPGWEAFCGVIRWLPWSFLYIPAWLANCVLWFGLFALATGKLRRARISARLAVILALSAWRPDETLYITPLIGYYVWVLSMVIFLISAEVHSRMNVLPIRPDQPVRNVK